jgi:hypothetical protein
MNLAKTADTKSNDNELQTIQDLDLGIIAAIQSGDVLKNGIDFPI